MTVLRDYLGGTDANATSWAPEKTAALSVAVDQASG